MFITNQEAIDDRTMKIERQDIKGSGFIEFPPQKPFSEKIIPQPPTVSHEALPEYYQDMPGVCQSAPAAQGTGQVGRGMAGRGHYQPAAVPRPAAQMQAPGAAAGQRPSQYAAPQREYVPQQHAAAPRPAAASYGMAGRGAGRGPGRGQPQGQAYDSREAHRPATNGYQGQGGGMHAPTHQAAQQPAPAAGRGGYAAQGRGAGRVAAPAGRGGYPPRPAVAAGPGRGRGAPASGRGPGAHAAGLPPRPAAQAPARPAPSPVASAPVGGSDSDEESGGVKSRSQMKRLRKKKREGKAP